MPIYEFECAACEARFEALAEVDAESVECRRCGAPGAERRLSIFATTRQPTARQRRKLEDKRGIDRGGAGQRWKQSMDRARGRKQR